MTSIPVPGHKLVVLQGDEMAQVAFEQITRQFISPYVNIELVDIDLSAENRMRTNGRIVQDAINALIQHGVGVKNAGITVNRDQKEAFLKAMPELNETELNPLATKSPNGAIRKGIGGNIIREDIPFTNLRPPIPDWIDRDIEVVTMMSGGQLDSFNLIAQFTGELNLYFTGPDGKRQKVHSRPIKKGDPLLLATNEIAKVEDWARDFFRKALHDNKDAYMGLKDTVIPGYDGVMKIAAEHVFKEEFAEAFEKAGLKYHYGLIDAQAAQMVVHPPERAVWGIPDNTTGRKLLKLVNSLKKFGVADRPHNTAIARMSSGGGDQYGSFNMPAPEKGFISIAIDDRVLHARDVAKGDPIILQTNDPEAIAAWMHQVFTDAQKKDEEVYVGLKREYMAYDAKFSDIINDVREEFSRDRNTPPPLMVMTPSKQLRKMVCDPPRRACYASLNLDGDIFSDITAALGGSLATASSIIASPEGTLLFEAPHGTAPDLYEKYLASDGKEAHFNPSALIYAFANALDAIGERTDNSDLRTYAENLKNALIQTVADGYITGDLRGKTADPSKEKLSDMFEFLNAVETRLNA